LAEEAALDFSKREAVWIERMFAANLWPYLLICGASHIQSFDDALARAGKTVHVERRNWPQK
jgi:hypothetical protein